MGKKSDSMAQRLRYQHLTINELTAPLDQRSITEKVEEGKWSIAENIAHLGRYQEVFLERLSRILKEELPEFGRYRAEEDGEFGAWLKKPIPRSLKDLTATRNEINDLINSLSSGQLQKKGKHPKLGWMNVIEWTEFFLLHEAHHLYAIFWLKHESKP